MNEINNIQNKINELVQIIDKDEKEFSSSPNDLALELTLSSYKYHLSELQTELRIELEKREKEFIEIRLKGQDEDGTIPLSFLAKLANDINGFILNYGGKREGKKLKEVTNSLDLRLVGIASGSTRIYITAKTAPDLFGNSLSSESLESSFKLLNAQNPTDLTDTAVKIGKESFKKINQFVSTISRSHAEVEMKWTSPNNKTFEWSGDKQTMSRLINTFTKIEILEPETIKFNGEITEMNIWGTFEIRDNKTKVDYKVKYIDEFLKQFTQLRLRDYCAVVLEKRIARNATNNIEKYSYYLISIKKIQTPRQQKIF